MSRRVPIRGRGAVAFRLFDWLGPSSGTSEWDIPMEAGHRIRSPRTSRVGWAAAFTGTYEEPELAMLLRLFEPGSCALDVGANFGFYTVPLAMAARQHGGRVVAFEPVPANVAFLRRNVVENGLSSVVDVRPIGLGDERARVPFETEPGGAGDAHAMVGDFARPTPEKELLAIERLDEIDLRESMGARRCSVVKLDVQGFETRVLAGGARFIGEHRPVVLAEFSPWHRERFHIPKDAPARFCDAHRYVAFEVIEERRTPLSDRKRARLVPLARGWMGDAFMEQLLVPEERARQVEST